MTSYILDLRYAMARVKNVPSGYLLMVLYLPQNAPSLVSGNHKQLEWILLLRRIMTFHILLAYVPKVLCEPITYLVFRPGG